MTAGLTNYCSSSFSHKAVSKRAMFSRLSKKDDTTSRRKENDTVKLKN